MRFQSNRLSSFFVSLLFCLVFSSFLARVSVQMADQEGEFVIGMEPETKMQQ